MSKTIYWIDDSIQRMNFIMQGVFPRFWGLDKPGDEFCTKIIIFGNQAQMEDKKLYTCQDEWDFQNKLEDFLFETCQSYGGISWENSIYKDKRRLIQNAVNILFKEWPDSKNPERILRESWNDWKKKNELYNDICRLWQADGSCDVGDDVLAAAKVDELLKLINIGEHGCVGVDLALLHGDIDYIKSRKCRIISMELYNKIKESHQCFLYSTSTHDKDFIDTWKAVYSQFYHEDNVKIYQRVDLMEKRKSDAAIDEIMNMLKEEKSEA